MMHLHHAAALTGQARWQMKRKDPYSGTGWSDDDEILGFGKCAWMDVRVTQNFRTRTQQPEQWCSPPTSQPIWSQVCRLWHRGKTLVWCGRMRRERGEERWTRPREPLQWQWNVK